MTSDTRLIIKPIDHLKSGSQLTEDDARVYFPSKLSLSTDARVSAAQLSGEIPVVDDFMPEVGSMCMLEATDDNGTFIKVFVGFIFNYSVDRWGVVNFTAYDSMRYLQNPVSGKWVGRDGIDVSEIVRSVIRSCGLEQMSKEMQAETVGVKPIRLIKIAEPGINVIDEVLEWAQLKATANENGVTTKGGSKYAATKPAERWVLVDNCGTFLLCTANQLGNKVMGWTEPPVIGIDAGVTEFNLEVNIDETANKVWLLRASEHGAYGCMVEDADNIRRWGPLTYYEKIDNAYCRNNDQMKLRAAIEICSRDNERRTVNITALGLTGLRAGMLVRINIPWLNEAYFGEVSRSKLVYLDHVTHEWEEGVHMMSMNAFALPGDIDVNKWIDRVKSPDLPKKKTKTNKK